MNDEEYLIKNDNQIKEEVLRDFIQAFRLGVEYLIDTYGKEVLIEELKKQQK